MRAEKHQLVPRPLLFSNPMSFLAPARAVRRRQETVFPFHPSLTSFLPPPIFFKRRNDEIKAERTAFLLNSLPRPAQRRSDRAWSLPTLDPTPTDHPATLQGNQKSLSLPRHWFSFELALICDIVAFFHPYGSFSSMLYDCEMRWQKRTPPYYIPPARCISRVTSISNGLNSFSLPPLRYK